MIRCLSFEEIKPYILCTGQYYVYYVHAYAYTYWALLATATDQNNTCTCVDYVAHATYIIIQQYNNIDIPLFNNNIGIYICREEVRM